MFLEYFQRTTFREYINPIGTEVPSVFIFWSEVPIT